MITSLTLVFFSSLGRRCVLLKISQWSAYWDHDYKLYDYKCEGQIRESTTWGTWNLEWHIIISPLNRWIEYWIIRDGVWLQKSMKNEFRWVNKEHYPLCSQFSVNKNRNTLEYQRYWKCFIDSCFRAHRCGFKSHYWTAVFNAYLRQHFWNPSELS